MIQANMNVLNKKVKLYDPIDFVPNFGKIIAVFHEPELNKNLFYIQADADELNINHTEDGINIYWTVAFEDDPMLEFV